MAGPDVGKRPSKKKMIKKGTPSRRPGGMAIKPKTGGGVEWGRKKVVKGAKWYGKTVKEGYKRGAYSKAGLKKTASKLWKKFAGQGK